MIKIIEFNDILSYDRNDGITYTSKARDKFQEWSQNIGSAQIVNVQLNTKVIKNIPFGSLSIETIYAFFIA